ncbi:MAG: hypothetical protein GY796_25495 [Chloroflexi bacterium]|nr:hypothetical protein [Chloroflexota bacterium]
MTNKKAAVLNLSISLTTVIFMLLAIELGARIVKSEPVLQIKDYRGTVQDLYREDQPVQYDALLGWLPQVGYAGADNKWKTQVTILADGVRANGRASDNLQTPPILAVGDSFTFGDEVSDDETWPAILESLSGQQVINGGVFAYGVDQSFLRMQNLLPLYQPEIVVMSFIPDDIRRTEYSVALGASKPYFQIVDDKLQLMNTPVPQEVEQKQESFLHRLLGYSFLTHKVMMKVNPSWWLTGRSWSEGSTGNSGAEISCAIFQQLADVATENGVSNVYLLVQDLAFPAPPDLQTQVDDALQCANSDVVTVIDLRDDLQKLAGENPVLLNSYFQDHVHMVYEGNAFVAQTILAAMHSQNEE